MPIELSGRRVFIASPGGLEGERAVIRKCLANFNERVAPRDGVAFLPCGWETLVGTVRRPQDAINPMLREADYAIFVLRERWGSPTGGDLDYSSGTEEEFNEALAAIRDPGLPMVDLLLIFLTVPAAQLNDPGPNLTKVLAFRAQIENDKTLLYNSIDSVDELAQRVGSALTDWATNALKKREIQMKVEPGGNLADDLVGVAQLSPNELSKLAGEHAARGEPVQAEILYSQAARSRDPAALLQFARFMRRVGRFERAGQLNLSVLEVTAHSSEPVLIAARSSALANLGVVRRKQGDLREARLHLEEAVKTARPLGDLGRKELEYALDNLGITCEQQGDRVSAMAALEESRESRRVRSDRDGEAKSLVNLARIHLSAGDTQQAQANLESAIATLEHSAGSEASLANALVAYGELLVNTGEPEASIAHSERALFLNRGIANSDGVGIASALRARAALELDDLDSASTFTKISHDECLASGNQIGEVVTRRLRASIALKQGDSASAEAELQSALETAQSIGHASTAAIRAELDQLRA